MQLLFPVNQAEALRLGIDAPVSTVSVNIDPESFSPEERAVLADCIGESWRVGVGSRELGTTVLHKGRVRPVGGRRVTLRELHRPNVEGVREAIADFLNYEREVNEVHAQERAKKTEDLRRFLAEYRREMRRAFEHGMHLDLPVIPAGLDTSGVEDRDLVKQAQDLLAALQRERREIIDGALRARERREAEAERARVAAREGYLARLSDVQRRMLAAGYGDPDEFIRELMIADARAALNEFIVDEDWDDADWDFEENPTPEEFLTIEQICKRLPEGHVRLCRRHDDVLGARAQWSSAGVKAVIFVHVR